MKKDINEPGAHQIEMTPVNKTKTAKSGGKGNYKMPKQEAVKQAKKYQKTRGEHAKDIVIAILIASIVAFVAGISYANGRQAQIDSAVKNAVSNQTAAEATTKK